MADDVLTVADLVADALDLYPNEVSDLIDMASFVARLPVLESTNGTTHKYSKETGAPVVGFRAENDGIDLDHSVDTVVSVALKILSFSSRVDQAVASASPKGAAHVIARKLFRHLKAAMFYFERQIFQGTGFDAAGFSGLINNTGLDGLADEMVTGAGGTPVGAVTSAWLMKLGEDDVAGVMVPDNPLDVGETVSVEIAGASGSYPGWWTPGTTWLGLQIAGARSAARICNIDPTGATGTFDDDAIIDAIEAFPNGNPDVIVMNRSARKLLRKSRTATNPTGDPAPIPTNVEGIPILKVESIPDTEAVVA